MFCIQHIIQFGVLIYPINLKVLEWSHQAQAAKLSQDVQMSDESCMYKCAHFTTYNCHLFKMQTVNALNCQQFLTHFFRKADHTLSTKIAAIAIGPPHLSLLCLELFDSSLYCSFTNISKFLGKVRVVSITCSTETPKNLGCATGSVDHGWPWVKWPCQHPQNEFSQNILLV